MSKTGQHKILDEAAEADSNTESTAPPVIYLHDELKNLRKAPTRKKPAASMGHRRVNFNRADDAGATAFKVLRTQIARRMREQRWTTLAITSSNPSEGKTFTAANLAVSFANQMNFPVLLVDLDLRRPTLSQYFENTTSASIEDHLVRNTPLEQVWFRPEDVDQLFVLPARNTITNSSEILSSGAMAQMVETVRKLFAKGIVIFDLPPLLHTDDVLAFSPFMDALLLVVEESQTKWKDLKVALELLEGLPVIGNVLNKSKTASRYYY